MTIVELREKRAKLWATMEGFLDTHRDRKGVLSAEDDAVYAKQQEMTPVLILPYQKVILAKAFLHVQK